MIDSIEIRHYRLPLDPPFRASWDQKPRMSFTTTLVRVCAGELEGVGSGAAMLGFAGHEDLFVGQDPFAIERHVQVLDQLQFHYGRMWPLEIALWDLMGKLSGQPLWKLLGGRSNTVRAYASTGERLPAQFRVKSALRMKGLGFPGIKLRFFSPDVREDIAMVRAVRDAVGAGMKIMVDAHQGWKMPWDTSPAWDVRFARRVADELAELDVFWLEEPLPRQDYRGLAELRRSSKIQIAGGEGNRAWSDYREYLRHGSLDVYQPDAAWGTGLLRARQIAMEVQGEGAMYSPHAWGDGLSLLANMHLFAAVSTAPFMEYPFDPPTWSIERRDFILPVPIYINNGTLTLPNKPGLGVEVDWEALEKYRIETGIME
ncbi:MAG: mandelate racemase/muconate lactonizing enzyme family protein [Anaerolineales bacterium]|nr:mandelate racemase/muconate lactonizing enzyme family protein [Anaerolineales bacterium]